MTRTMETFEVGQPWVTYTYGLTHDLWWPIWSSTRLLGHAKIICTCCVCGARQTLRIKMPRFRGVPDKGHHPARLTFLGQHAHPDRGHPMSWVLPFRNMAAHEGGISLDLMAMRIESEMNDESRSTPSDGSATDA